MIPRRRGTWLPTHASLRIACALLVLAVVAFVGLELYQRWVISAQRMTLTAVGRYVFFPGVPTTFRIVVRDAVLGTPLGGVEVAGQIEAEVAQEPRVRVPIPAVTTNDHGVAQLHVDIPVGTQPGHYRLAVRGGLGPDASDLAMPVLVRRGARGAMISVDKPRYQPGQTMLMRGLVLAPDRRPAAQTKVAFVVTDSRGTVVSRQERTTSRFGIASAELELAPKLNLGRYNIFLTTPAGTVERKVTVGSHESPKFGIELDVDGDGATPGQPLTGRVTARYTYAQPVVGAAARVSGTRPGGETVTTVGTTDERGVFAFELTSPAGARIAQLEAEISGDGIGRQLASREVAVSAVARSEDALSILIVPETRELVRGVDNAVYFVVTDRDRKPVAATLRGVATQPFTISSTELGVAKLELAPHVFETAIDVEVTAEDLVGRWGHAAQALPTNVDDGAFRLRTDKAAYATGDTVVVTARSALPGTLHIDMVDSQRTVAATEIDIGAGRAEGTLVVPAQAAGVVELRAFRQHGAFQSTINTRRLFVVPKDDLQLSLTFDKESYPPGEEATLSVLVRGELGKPVQAALGLVGIDRAASRAQSRAAELTGAHRPVASTVTEASPELVSLLPRTDATATERAAQQVMLAAADPFFYPAKLAPRDFLDTDYVPATVVTGDTGWFRQAAERKFWETDRRAAMRVIALALLVLSLLWTGLTMRNAYDVHERAIREGPPPRTHRAWTWMVFAAATSTMAFAPLFADRGLDWPAMPSFVGWLVLWSSSGAMLWHAAGHMSAARSLRRLGWSVCGLHLVTHAAAMCGFFLEPPFEGLVVMAAGSVMLVVTATVGTARTVFETPGRRAGIVAFVTQLALVSGVAAASTFVIDRWVLGTEVTDVGRLERVRDFLDVLEREEATGARELAANDATGATTAKSPTKVKDFFPETLFWEPEVVTGPDGKASVPIDLVNSITTWDITATAVSADGRLGTGSTTVRGFQDVSVVVDAPRHVTRGDEVAVPVVAFNHLAEVQDVDIEVAATGGLRVVGKSKQRVRVDPHRSASVMVLMRAEQTGVGELVAAVTGTSVGAATQHTVTIHPAEQLVVSANSGVLSGAHDLAIAFPDGASGRELQLKIYSNRLSEVTEGLRGVFQRPYGCFEQTVSTTYPSLLAWGLMREGKSSTDALEAEVLTNINDGFQRLLSFEVGGGGFSLFGRAPAQEVLTAYALMLFSDLAQLQLGSGVGPELDPALLERTRSWLFASQHADGRWDARKGAIRQTAFVAWALAESGAANEKLGTALNHVASSPGLDPDDPYVLALRANALIAGGRQRDAQVPLDRLMHLRDPKTGSWRSSLTSLLYSGGRASHEETTALCARAFSRAKRNPEVSLAAVTWLNQQRTATGTWHSPAATVAAMRALIAQPDAGKRGANVVAVSMNGEPAAEIELAGAETIYVSTLLGGKLTDDKNQLTLTPNKDVPVPYQLVSTFLIPWGEETPPSPDAPLLLNLTLDRTELAVGEMMRIDAEMIWRKSDPIRMPMLEIGVPPSMDVVTEDLDALQRSGQIELWGRSAQHVVLYLPLTAGTSKVRMRLRAKHPARAKLPATRAYAYDDPDVIVEIPPKDIVVR